MYLCEKKSVLTLMSIVTHTISNSIKENVGHFTLVTNYFCSQAFADTVTVFVRLSSVVFLYNSVWYYNSSLTTYITQATCNAEEHAANDNRFCSCASM